jgi:hypothetical protein
MFAAYMQAAKKQTASAGETDHQKARTSRWAPVGTEPGVSSSNKHSDSNITRVPLIVSFSACRTARSGGTTMAFQTTVLGRTWPSARRGLQGLATAGGPTRSEQVHHRLARVAADRPDLMTDRVAAQICHVGPRMIGLWIETGAWPLPHAIGARTLYFRGSDVECWLKTGTWPAGVRFRSRGSANQDR